MSVLYQAFVYLLAAVIAVPVARRLGLGSIIGYLLAGVIIGPYVLHLTPASGDIMHFAEFGVVMMLFLIGLELRPALLWQLRSSIFGMGASQLLITAIVIGAIGLFAGLNWKAALAIGLILAMSSTAIVLQTLGEKGQLKTPGGEAAFSVLLFQDLAVIPVLAVMPLLGGRQAGQAGGLHQAVTKGLAAWEQTVLVLGAVAVLVFAGRYLLRPFFRYIAATRLRELFTAAALLLVVAIVLLMEKVGLSPALGAFLAGVLLAESEYRVQLETDIEPFKGLLLGLFFISVGESMDFTLVMSKPLLIALLVPGLLFVKFVALLLVGRLFKLQTKEAFLFGFALAQGGEFAFVLFSFATQQSVFPTETANLLVAVVALSMAAAPVLLAINDRFVQPRFRAGQPKREPDSIDERGNPVIVAGFGRFGNIVGRLLTANGIKTTVLDYDPDQVETLRRFGIKTFYGDATRLDMLRAAGADQAKLLILALEDPAKAAHIIELARRHFPQMRILARAASRQHAYDLLRLGVPDVFRETLGSALDMGTVALEALGMNHARAQRAAQIFREHDEAAVREMAQLPDDDEAYASSARLHNENLIRALQADRELNESEESHGKGMDKL